MFGSKNNTFYKSKEELEGIYSNMNAILTLKGHSQESIWRYKKAFQYFINFPDKFDGATIAKDLNDLPNLDLDAMVHDYEYITGANTSFVRKWKADFRYIKNMERNGKGLRLIRLLLLTIIGVIFVTYCIIKKKI